MQRQLDGLTDESRACRAGRAVAAAAAEPRQPAGGQRGRKRCASGAGAGTLRRARTTRAQTHTLVVVPTLQLAFAATFCANNCGCHTQRAQLGPPT